MSATTHLSEQGVFCSHLQLPACDQSIKEARRVQAAARGQEQEPGQEGDGFQAVDLHSDEEEERGLKPEMKNSAQHASNTLIL